ncbi:MAG: hypothetical protein IPL26_29990 [Leptospiraceae bacterium]|nr:hypothetical protein [Leptospiraceae bacterium]
MSSKKRKDPFEILISKVTEKAEAEMNILLDSLNSHIDSIFSKPKIENSNKKPTNPQTKFYADGKPFEFTPYSEREKFEKAKDITPKVRRSTE